MRRPFFAALATLVFALAQPASAWNYVTHRVIAAIAYDHLNPATRARVDALIRMHPDYSTMFLKDAPTEEPQRSRAAFIAAAIWADQLRSDPRFYDESAADPHPTPALPGFPDMKRHGGWHFTDLPFTQDGTPLAPTGEPNVVSELQRLLVEIAAPDTTSAQLAYDLPWVIHLLGDIHAPLHCVSRFTKDFPKGDEGGNHAFVPPGVTLHKFWDDAVGTDTSAEFVDRTAEGLASNFQAESLQTPQKVLNPVSWANESLGIAQRDIYTFGTQSGTHDRPVPLAEGYSAHAHQIADYQAVKAAYRLAAVLDQSLR